MMKIQILFGKFNIGGQKYHDVVKTMYGCDPLTWTHVFL